MGIHRVLSSSERWLGGGLVLALGGLLLVGIGLGTARDYLVAQSYPVGAREALLLRSEYTMAGIFLLLGGIGITRVAFGDGGETD